MSKMFVPKSVRRMRFEQNREISTENNLTKSLEYLARTMKRIVVSEKHLLETNLLVVDVNPETDKLLIKKALEALSEGNKVEKITSSNRKATARVFRGYPGKTSAYKRMYIRFNSMFDSSILTGGEG